MAGGSLLALLDDISTVLDDVSLMTKVAAKKTAGVLGDDLALNAEQVTGVRAERELPVVWAVAKGSAVNKVILVPAALLLSAVAPWLVLPLLMLGGLYLCFEGTEKLVHALFHRHEKVQENEKLVAALTNPQIDLVAFEKQKIRGAIRTDMVLSAEIIVIALGTVSDKPFVTQALVVAVIAAVITAGVYGLVALIVKLDDMGLALLKETAGHVWARFKRAVGRALLAVCPWLMKTLSVVGTAAMFLVGGGILVHGVPALHHLIEQWSGLFTGASLMINLAVGIIAGAAALAVVSAAGKAIKHW